MLTIGYLLPVTVFIYKSVDGLACNIAHFVLLTKFLMPSFIIKFDKPNYNISRKNMVTVLTV